MEVPHLPGAIPMEWWVSPKSPTMRPMQLPEHLLLQSKKNLYLETWISSLVFYLDTRKPKPRVPQLDIYFRTPPDIQNILCCCWSKQSACHFPCLGPKVKAGICISAQDRICPCWNMYPTATAWQKKIQHRSPISQEDRHDRDTQNSRIVLRRGKFTCVRFPASTSWPGLFPRTNRLASTIGLSIRPERRASWAPKQDSQVTRPGKIQS